MSFASMHNDYLDPDIHLWKDYDESLPENPEEGEEEDILMEDEPDPPN